MLVGPLFLTFAPPFFICIISILVLLALQWKTKGKRPLIPHSYGVITKPRRKKLIVAAQITLVSIAGLSALLMLFASLNPQIVKTATENINARRILITCDISGSMTVGFEESSSLPSLAKTRLGQAGKFIQEFVEKRKGDSFAIVCFSTEAYVARDFTSDATQIKEFLAPANLVGALKEGMFDVSESLKIKERAFHKGTWAIGGINLSKDFILSHADYAGNEAIIYLGDLESQSGSISAFVAEELQKVKEEHGIKTYAVLITKDYDDKDEQRAAADIAKIKLEAFKGTGVPAYEAHNLQDIEKIVGIIARDIPKSLTEEKIIEKYSLAPRALLSVLVLMFAAIILNAKFPRVP